METMKEFLRDRMLWWQAPLLFLVLYFVSSWNHLSLPMVFIGLAIALVTGTVFLLLNRKYRREFEQYRKQITGSES